MSLQQVLYTARATATGGRDGAATSDDGRLNVKLSVPKGLGGDDGAGTNQRIVANSHAGQEKGAAANPNIAADPDGATELESAGAERRVAGVIGGEDLHAGADLCHVADQDVHDIEHDAAEVHEDAAANPDVEAIVAMERRPDERALTHAA